RFCTIYRSESGVQETLTRYHDDFLNTLARLEGKHEWGIKIYCDRETLAQKVGEISDKVTELKAEIATKSSGMAYFLKKRLEQTIVEEMERVSDECAQGSHDRLSSNAEEAVINPLQNKEITGRQGTMILNGAYLVAERQLTAFRAELAGLEKAYNDLGFSYEMTGPWPPYNFVAIGVGESVTDDSANG
ncbi:MAG: GvpL/GvpF family gas vesicle protein, partial [Chloroflexi bacterium]|nr:GvpL/GvpF family gas vesicle protein [Chloroflexota bacterium]